MQIKNISNKKSDKAYILSGMTSNIKEVPVKTDSTKKLIVFDITDNTGSVGAVLFPRVYKQYINLIINGTKLKIKGRIKRTKDDTTVIVQSCEV